MHALVLNDDEDGDILRLNGGKVDDRSGRMTVDVFNLPGETKRLGQMLTRMSMLLTIEVRSNQLEKKFSLWSSWKSPFWPNWQHTIIVIYNISIQVWSTWQTSILIGTKFEMIANQRQRWRRQPWRLNRWDFVLLSPLVISKSLRWCDIYTKTGYFSPWIELCRRKTWFHFII